MFHREILGFVASLLVLAFLPFAVACTTSGDRARLGCPAGEQCSTMVDGLHFAGVVPRAHSLFAIATGGTERIRVQTAPGLSGAAYADAFDARSSDAAILDIASVDGSEVTVIGGAGGHAFLRILEPGTDLLLDRVDVRVSPVSSVGVTSFVAALSGASNGEITAVWADASLRLVVGLRDPEGAFLWDDSLEVVGHPSTLVELPPGLEISALAPASGSLVLTLIRDAETNHQVSLPVVRSATGIVLFLGGDVVRVEVGSTTSICALGQAAGGLIAGAPVDVTLPAIVIEAPEAAPVVDGAPLQGCVGLRGVTLGTGTATVAIGTRTTDVQITVVAGASPLTGPAIDLADAQGWATAGERAAD